MHCFHFSSLSTSSPFFLCWETVIAQNIIINKFAWWQCCFVKERREKNAKWKEMRNLCRWTRKYANGFYGNLCNIESAYESKMRNISCSSQWHHTQQQVDCKFSNCNKSILKSYQCREKINWISCSIYVLMWLLMKALFMLREKIYEQFYKKWI